MKNPGNPYQKKGNNTLFLVLGVLMVILMGLIYMGSMRQSSVSQLIDAAAPDSSAFADDSLLTPPPAVSEPEPEEEEVKAKTEVKTDSSQITPSIPVNNEGDSTTKASTPDVSEPVKVVESGEGSIYSYKVKRGDTMYKIAARFGNRPADVLALNGMADMNLQADKDIKVKVKGIHNVVNGEGLNAIAQKYSVPVKSLKIANGLSGDILSDGTQLIIPLK